jgi:predicted ABC-type ATPase
MISTEQLHKNNNNNDFYGDFQKYRRMMDSNYFSNYTEERQELQDKIITKYLSTESLKCSMHKENPWIFFTCGPFGAGKTHSLRYLHDQNYLNLYEYILIDPDKLKYELPEASDYIQKDPINAGALLHKESTFLSLMIQYIVLDRGQPMIIDGSLRNVTWNLEHMNKIRKHYPGYNLGIIKVQAEIPVMLERARKRAEITGRIIPDHIIISTYNDIAKSFPHYLTSCNIYIIIDNNYQPRVERISLVNPVIY